jgi:hypothetical protein
LAYINKVLQLNMVVIMARSMPTATNSLPLTTTPHSTMVRLKSPQISNDRMCVEKALAAAAQHQFLHSSQGRDRNPRDKNAQRRKAEFLFLNDPSFFQKPFVIECC